MKIVLAEVISCKPEKVFPWIAEPEKAMKWQKNVKGGEIIVNRPEKVGTTFKEVIEEDGKSLEMVGTITKYINNKIIGFHLESKIHVFDVSYSVEEINKGTKVSMEALIHWKFPMNVMSVFIGNKMRDGILQQLHSEFLELKRLCEGE